MRGIVTFVFHFGYGDVVERIGIVIHDVEVMIEDEDDPGSWIISSWA